MDAELFYPVKRKFNALGAFFSILILIGGIYGVFLKKNESSLTTYIYYLPLLLVGGIFLFFNLRSHFLKKSGLYLNSKSLVIKSEFIAHELKWEDIKLFRSFDMMKQPWIAIEFFDNDTYFKGKNYILRTMGKIAIKKFGTPISILVNSFEVSRPELLATLNYYLEKYR